ncbi:hypothetical protein BGLA2_1710039 [Burkholderia gladioli]|nr:hypothetical protein BGLA2_1710039 [Burkholderia gladioli]
MPIRYMQRLTIERAHDVVNFAAMALQPGGTTYIDTLSATNDQAPCGFTGAQGEAVSHHLACMQGEIDCAGCA